MHRSKQSFGLRRANRWLLAPWLLISVLLAGLLLAGCQPASQTATEPSTLAGPVAPRQLPLEAEWWDVYFMGEAKVGHAHTVVRNDGSQRETTSEHELRLQRFGQTVVQQVRLFSRERLDGELLAARSEQHGGPTPVVTTVEASSGLLTLETTTQGQTTQLTYPWLYSWRGFFGVEQSLERQPLAPGETRQLTVLMALFNQLAKVELTARDYEETTLLAGSARLLRVDQRATFGEQSLDSVLWIDPAGRTIKTHLPGLGQTTYRVDRETALAPADATRTYDLGLASVVKLSRPVDDPHAAARRTYRVRLTGTSPAEVFPATPGQLVAPRDEHTADITLVRLRPDEPATADFSSDEPTAADLAPNNLIQSDDPLVVQLAAEGAPAELTGWPLAVALEKYVRSLVRQKNFSQALATAADVARTREGDCTEHAVLLAALLRARGVPARAAMGLVYYPPEQGFAFHMWTEAWIDGRWLPLDATLGRGGIGAGHLKLAHSPLAGPTAYHAFLPVAKVFGQLELEAVEED